VVWPAVSGVVKITFPLMKSVLMPVKVLSGPSYPVDPVGKLLQ